MLSKAILGDGFYNMYWNYFNDTIKKNPETWIHTFLNSLILKKEICLIGLFF